MKIRNGNTIIKVSNYFYRLSLCPDSRASVLIYTMMCRPRGKMEVFIRKKPTKIFALILTTLMLLSITTIPVSANYTDKNFGPGTDYTKELKGVDQYSETP